MKNGAEKEFGGRIGGKGRKDCLLCRKVKKVNLKKIVISNDDKVTKTEIYFCALSIQTDVDQVKRDTADHSRGASALIGCSLLHGSPACPHHDEIFIKSDISRPSTRHWQALRSCF